MPERRPELVETLKFHMGDEGAIPQIRQLAPKFLGWRKSRILLQDLIMELG